jgi:hypothetical protein
MGRRRNRSYTRNSHADRRDENNNSNNRMVENQKIEANAGAHEAHDETTNAEHRKNERALARWTGVVAFLTGGLVFVGAITGYIFWLQLGAMQGQLDAIERDQRPFVWLSAPEMPHFEKGQLGSLTPKPPDTGYVVWNWQFNNFGKSYAHNLRMSQYIKLGDGLYKPSYGATKEPFLGDLPPGKTGNFASIISDPGFTEGEFNQLMKNEAGIGALIEIGYFDGAGKKFSGTLCMTHLASGAIALPDPATCKKQQD